jgi:hypothetical protein
VIKAASRLAVFSHVILAVVKVARWLIKSVIDSLSTNNFAQQIPDGNICKEL